jgi:hypothetical protein
VCIGASKSPSFKKPEKLIYTTSVLFVARRKPGRGSEKGNMGRDWY